jgi:hypothetical protein
MPQPLMTYCNYWRKGHTVSILTCKLQRPWSHATALDEVLQSLEETTHMFCPEWQHAIDTNGKPLMMYCRLGWFA